MNWQELKQSSLNDILAWAEPQPWCRAMADCSQDAEWHSEGDVWTHTKMVCQQLAGLSSQPTIKAPWCSWLVNGAVNSCDPKRRSPSTPPTF